MGLNILKKIAKMSLELLGLLLELLLLLLYASYHVLIREREAPHCNPFEGSQTGSRAHPLRFGLAQAAFAPSFALAALERQKDMRSAGCVALRLRFCARTWPFDLDFARSDGFWEAPDVDFRG